jgi:hypothetical protein
VPAPSSDNPLQRSAWLAWAVVGFAALSLMCTHQTPAPQRPAATASAPTPTPVAHTDNAACLSCHENLKDEMITRVHQRHSRFCTDCHGQSTAHAAGGTPQPPPDHVFAGAEIAALCTHCHHRHSDEMIARVVQRRQGRKSPHGQPITAESTCTDCHGRHVREG